MRMNAPATLIDLLRDRVAAKPADLAYTFLDDGERCGESTTWEQLERRSRAVAAAIMQRVEPGTRVLLMFPPRSTSCRRSSPRSTPGPLRYPRIRRAARAPTGRSLVCAEWLPMPA